MQSGGRYPTIVTVDTGAVKLRPYAELGAECEHPGHQPLLIIQSDNQIVSLAGSERELLSFASDIILAVFTYQDQREGSQP